MIGKTTPVLIIAIALLASCNSPSGPERPTTYKPLDLKVPTKVGDPFQPGQQQTNPTSNTVLPVTTTQPATKVTAAGLNPEHGQPGHRCDIAVGAPLNSAPTTPAITTSPQTNNPVMINPSQPLDVQKSFSTATTTPTMTPTTGAGLNPEHGKPGHRCDIAVGAPLDSKPTTPAVTTTPVNTTPANTTTSIPAVTPILPSPVTATPVAKTDGVTAPGMNPEHGKPGHRCDIAVGAPLDSKPTEKPIEKKN